MSNILRRQIVSTLIAGFGAFHQLLDLGFSKDEIREFRDAFMYSGKSSVDAFLEHRTEFIKLGKAAIAQVLIPCENLDTLFGSWRQDVHEDWYQYLFDRLNCPFEEFERNKLSVITYNYDRSFEQYLFTALKNTYNKPEEEVADNLSKVPVIHLHGRLGGLPWQRRRGRDYAPDSSLDAIKAGMEDIRIIYEDMRLLQDVLFYQAKELVSGAKRVIFLGFGYDETNLQRLGFDLSKFPGPVYGSCYGFTGLERESLLQRFGRRTDVTLGQPDEKVLTFLRNNVPLS